MWVISWVSGNAVEPSRRPLLNVGGPGRVRTVDLFHAMEDETYHLQVRTLKINNL